MKKIIGRTLASLMSLVIASALGLILFTAVTWAASATTAGTTINASSVTLKGSLLSGAPAYCGFEYGTSSTLSAYTSVSCGKLTSTGNFSANITGLSSNTTYYYRVYPRPPAP